MGSMVVWILWSGLLDSWDWLLYSAVGRAMSLLPSCLGSPNQAGVCTEYPGQVRLLVLLFRLGEPWLTGLLDVLHGFRVLWLGS